MVLPVIKIILKRFVARVAEDQVDRMPTRVASVDVFNAMYQSKCMQTTGSTWITVAIIAIDVVQNVYSIRRLMHQMKEIEELANETKIAGTDAGLLDQVIGAFANPENIDLQSAATLRIRGCNSVELQTDSVAKIQRIETAQGREKRSSFAVCKPSSARKLSQQMALRSSIVAPYNLTSDDLSSNPLTSSGKSSSQIPPFPLETADQKRARAVVASLDLVWKCELLLLVEYVEAAIHCCTRST